MFELPLVMVRRMRTWLPTTAAIPVTRVSLALVVGTITALIILLGYPKCDDCLLRQYDDAYITFRYAHNLATGRGLVFNLGEATDSASSFLFTVLLAGLNAIGFHDLRMLALVIGISCAAGTSAIVFLSALERTRRPMVSTFLAIAVSCHGLIAGWAVSGMETLLFTFLVVLSVHRLFVRYAFGWRESALVTLVALARYEGLLLVVAWFALGVVRFARGSSTERKILASQWGAVIATLSTFLLFKWLSYGTLIPHAFALKQVTALYAPRPDELWQSWRSLAPTILLVAVAGLFTVHRGVHSVILIAYTLLSVASVALGPYADWVRYSVHVLPLLALLASVPISILCRRLPAMALAACAFLAYESYTSFGVVLAAFKQGAGHARCREQVGEFLEKNLAPNTTVISSDIGAIAYAAPSIRFIDTVGLTSSDVLGARAAGQSPEPILFQKAPTIVADTCSGSCLEPGNFSAYNWLVGENYWLTQLPEQDHYFDHLQEGRVLVRCQSPDGLWFGATQFIRR